MSLLFIALLTIICLLFCKDYYNLYKLIKMQRYGWQTRNSRAKASQSLPTNPEFSNLHNNQTETIDKEQVNQKQKNNYVSKDSQSISQVQSNQRQQSQKAGRVTKVSSISSNPLFQGLDYVPPRRIQTRPSQPLQGRKTQISNKQSEKQAVSDSISQASSQNSRLMTRSNISGRQNNQLNKPQTNYNIGNKTQNKVENTINNPRNIGSRQFQAQKEQAQKKQTSKIQVDSEVLNLRFNKTSKKSQSLLQMQNQSVTQRLPNMEKNRIETTSNSKIVQSKRPLATERKPGDDLIDGLFGNSRRIANRSSNTQSEASQLGNSNTRQPKKTPRYGQQKRQAATLTQNIDLRKDQSVNDDQSELTRSRKISIKSSIQPQTFSQSRRQRQQIQAKPGLQSTHATPISKLYKDFPRQQSHTSQFQIKPRRRSNLIIYCLNNLHNRKLEQCVTKLKSAKRERIIDKKFRFAYLSRIQKLIIQKNVYLCTYALNQFKHIHNQNKRSSIRQANKQAKSNKNVKLTLPIIINSIFKDHQLSTFHKININRKNTQLINLIVLYDKKVIRVCFNKVKIIAKNKAQTGEIYSKAMLKCIQQIYKQRLRRSLSLIKLRNVENKKLKAQQQQQEQRIYNIEYRTPIHPKHERSISNNEQYYILSQSKKQIPNRQTQEIKQSKQSNRRTSAAEDTRALKLQKQLKQASRQSEIEVNNLQFRIQQIKQIISQYNFQLEYKNMRRRQLEEMISSMPKQQQSMDRDRSIISSSNKLPTLADIYFAVARNPQRHIQINQLTAYKSSEPAPENEQNAQNWMAMQKNGYLKKEVQEYEKTLKGEQSGEVQQRRKTSWVFAYQEQEVISKLVRSYTKQLYYWHNARTTLSKIVIQHNNNNQ